MKKQKLERLKKECEKHIKKSLTIRYQKVDNNYYLTTKGYTIHILTLEEWNYLSLPVENIRPLNITKLLGEIENHVSYWIKDIQIDNKYNCSKYNLCNHYNGKFIESFYIDKKLLNEFMNETKNHKIELTGSTANKPFRVFDFNIQTDENELLGYIMPVRYIDPKE